MKREKLFRFLTYISIGIFCTGCGNNKDLDNNYEKKMDDSAINTESSSTEEHISEESIPTAESTTISDYEIDDNNTEASIDSQLAIIEANYDEWFISSEYDTFWYAITDLNQDGNLEIIISTCQGSGIYTYSLFYEISEGNELVQRMYELEEGESQPDIIKNELICYYNSDLDKYIYIVLDNIANGAAEYYNFTYGMVFDDDFSIDLDLLKSLSYFSDETTYEDMDSNIISETEYNEIEDLVFANYDKKICHIEWIDAAELEKDVNAGLVKSWKGFNIE